MAWEVVAEDEKKCCVEGWVGIKNAGRSKKRMVWWGGGWFSMIGQHIFFFKCAVILVVVFDR